MTSYCSDMCIVCFAPKRTDFHSLYALRDKVSGPDLSELGEYYEELMQIKLSVEESRPQFVCGYCKTRLSLFHQFKMKALEAYKKVSNENNKTTDPTDSQSSENLVKVEEITVYDASTKQTEKYEIQYLNDEDEVCETEIQDNSYFSSSEANSCDSNGPLATNLLVVKCTICLQSFENNETFTRHLKEHGEIPEYSCGQCQQKFHSKENFVNHIKIHDKNFRDFQCTLCGRVFTRLGHLRSHMQTHGDERPFDCKVCFKRFRSSSHLRYHSYSHEGKSFQCRVCLGLYSTPRTLVYHMNVVHKRCDVCDEAFEKRDELNAHKLSHKAPDCLLTATICID